jgi:AcrR family transcriptional regulator
MSRGSTSSSATRDRLLDAAEDLFSAENYEAVSIRSINAKAGVNIAATHYHFGSKDALVEAVIERRLKRFDPWRREQLAALTERPEPPTPREIIEVMALPLLDLIEREPSRGRGWIGLLARLFLSHTERGWTREWQSVSYPTWERALQRALPDVAPAELKVRWPLAVEAVLVSLGEPLAHGSEVTEHWTPLAFIEQARVTVSFAVSGLCGHDGGHGLDPNTLESLDAVV